jgi:hypothetical protein
MCVSFVKVVQRSVRCIVVVIFSFIFIFVGLGVISLRIKDFLYRTLLDD